MALLIPRKIRIRWTIFFFYWCYLSLCAVATDDNRVQEGILRQPQHKDEKRGSVRTSKHKTDNYESSLLKKNNGAQRVSGKNQRADEEVGDLLVGQVTTFLDRFNYFLGASFAQATAIFGHGGDGESDHSSEDSTRQFGECLVQGKEGALIPGLLQTNRQPLFEELVPNALDPEFMYQYDDNNAISIEMCKATNHVTGLINPDTGEKLTTTIYGYGQEGRGTCTWPGMTFEVPTHQKLYVRWLNKIPKEEHILTNVNGTASAVDTSLHWAYGIEGYETYTIATNGLPVVPHLHGGHSSFEFDGNPEFFFSPDWEIKGPQWRSEVFEYQDDVAGMLW